MKKPSRKSHDSVPLIHFFLFRQNSDFHGGGVLCLRRLHADRSQGEKEWLSHDVVYVFYVLIFCLINSRYSSFYMTFLCGLNLITLLVCICTTYLSPYAIATNVALIFLYWTDKSKTKCLSLVRFIIYFYQTNDKNRFAERTTPLLWEVINKKWRQKTTGPAAVHSLYPGTHSTL